MSVLFFLVSIWGALFTLNAMYPVRRNKLLFGPSFFASWMTIELAGHHLLWQGVATVVFVLARRAGRTGSAGWAWPSRWCRGSACW